MSKMYNIHLVSTLYYTLQEKSPSCDAHARPLEFYCITCKALLCSVCTLKKHRTHNCDLASDVIEKCKQEIKQQLDLLEESAAKVEAIVEKVDSATENVLDEGDKTRQEIIAKVDQLHHDLELGKTELIDMLDQGVQDKMDFLAHLREKAVNTLAQMRSSQSLVEETVQREHTMELLAAENELVRCILNACNQVDALKFTTPSAISFSFHSSRMEIGFLVAPVGLHHELKITKLVAGEKCSFLLYLVVTNEDDLVCQLVVPTHGESQAIECQISQLKKGKYQVSFTPHRVGIYNLTIVSASTKKLNISEIQVDSPFLRGSRRQTCIQVLRKPRSVAITKEGQLVVCERGADCITVRTSEGVKINTISSSGFKKQSVFKLLCVGVTHDNHIVVIDSGKHQRIQLHKLQLDGKIVSMSTITSKDVSNFQSPNSITEHPNGQLLVVDSASHCIHVFNADLFYLQSFGGKGDAPGQFNQPHSLAFDSSGNSYVSDSMNHRIQKFKMDGDLFNIFGIGDGSEASHLTQPTALCISSYDTIFVADKRMRIAAFDVQGDLLGEVRYDGISLENPCAMAVHKNESYMCVIDRSVEALYVIQ